MTAWDPLGADGHVCVEPGDSPSWEEPQDWHLRVSRAFKLHFDADNNLDHK